MLAGPSVDLQCRFSGTGQHQQAAPGPGRIQNGQLLQHTHKEAVNDLWEAYCVGGTAYVGCVGCLPIDLDMDLYGRYS